MLPNGTVLEFQHITLKSNAITEREEFYSKHANGMVWIVDGAEFMDRWVKYKWSPMGKRKLSNREKESLVS